jgi:hypothetical protein
MEIDDLNIILLELKYCERCGGLWLRVRGRQDAYCGPCAAQMSGLALPGGLQKLHAPLTAQITVEEVNGELMVVCGEGGHA